MTKTQLLIRNTTLFFIFMSALVFGQTPKASLQDIINQVNSDSAVYFVKELSGTVPTIIGGQSYTIVSRNKSQPGNDKAAEYIKQKLDSYGLQTTLQSFSTTGKNVIGTKTGTTFPNKKYIICAHFDDMPSGTTAPGADDNGSGTAGVIEAARVLQNYSFPFTVVFALWDEEEQGLVGSDYYATQASAAGDSIMGVVNMDMIAWENNGDNKVNIHARPVGSSMDIAAKMIELNATYNIGLLTNLKNPGITASDHASFWDVNYSAILLIEDDDNDFNQYYHTVNDKLQYYNIPFFKKNIQLALATFSALALNLNIQISHTPVASTSTSNAISVTANIQTGLVLGTGSNAPRLYYRTKQTGNYSAFSAVSGTASSGGNFNFTIPAQSLGTVVQYYIAAQDSAGSIVASSPKGASGFNPPGSTPPATFHSFYVANIATLFADSVMNLNNWTATGTWGLTTAKFVSPPNSFTDSPGGNYSNNQTTTITCNNEINLGTALGAFIEFNTQYALESGYDYVQFQVTTDNGTTWTPMPGLYTILGSGSFQPTGQPLYNGTQAAWVREKIDMSAFTNKTIKFRFLFKSDGSQLADGIYVDNVLFSAYTSTPQIAGWESPMTVKDNANNSISLAFGQKAGATDGIDAQLNEVSLPPPPPTGVMDARFILPGGTDASAKDFRDTSKTTITWRMTFQPGASYPMTFTWNPQALTTGSFFLKDEVTGTVVNVDMKQAASYTLTNSGISSLKIEFTRQICKDIPLTADWNIISLPVIVSNPAVSSIFPAATSAAYAFNNGYQQAATLENGKGYWIRYPQAATVNVCGTQPGNTVPLVSGWNLIGVYNNDILTALITTTPANIINSQFYGYSGGYVIPTSLVSGRGYWVRTSAAGVINLNAAERGVTAAKNPVRPEWARVIISDAAGREALLYLAGSSSYPAGSTFDLPPVPPQGIFDARFISDSKVEKINALNQVRISGAVYPVTVFVDGAELRITDAATGGKLISASISGKSRVCIDNPAVTLLNIESVEIPDDYVLMQNYPNPFNPNTTIRFTVPEKTTGTLIIYNQLGERVAVLVNGDIEAGNHSVEWQASSASSGVYFYELKTAKFTALKKLILMK